MDELIENQKPKYPIKVLLNVSKVLDCFIEENKPLQLADLKEKLDLYPSTIHRILDTLRYLGYIEYVPNSEKYQLGIKCIELGMSKLSQIELITVASPFLDKLSREFNENVYLAILHDGFVVYQAKKEVKRRIQITTHVGTRAHIHCTALGKVLITDLDEKERKKIFNKSGLPKLTKNTITDIELLEKEIEKVKKQDFATDNEENEYDINCIAAPIRDYSGKVIAAISISGPSYRFHIDRHNELKKEIIKYGYIISKKMGFIDIK